MKYIRVEQITSRKYMENPGSFNEQKEQYPELPEDEVLKLYEGALVQWRQYCRERIEYGFVLQETTK